MRRRLAATTHQAVGPARAGDMKNPRPRGRGQEPDTAVWFHAFASKHLATRKFEVSERMYEYEAWAVTTHLLPYFATWPVAELNIEAIDDYRRYKVQQAQQRREAIERGTPLRDDAGRLLKPLSASSVNKTIDVLQSILAVAVEYGLLETNPASGRRRRLKKPAKRPVHLDNVHQIQALLDAAAELDREPYWRMHDRRASIATLVLAGPRAIELTCALWRDVDLASGRIEIGRSKTEAGLREIHLLPLLRDELAAHKARSRRTGPDDLVFPNSHGGRRSVANLRARVLAPVLVRADELLAARGQTPLPQGVTPHKLRHTFASILVACGEDPTSVMAQLGHTDPKFTLRVYSHVMRRNPTERAQLKALVYGAPENTNDEMAAPRQLLTA